MGGILALVVMVGLAIVLGFRAAKKERDLTSTTRTR